MADLYTRVLVDVSYAAGCAGYSGAGDEVLTLLQQGTHHEAAALLAWDRLLMRHRPIASAGYGAETVEQLGDRYVASEENRVVEAASGPVRIDDVPRYRESPMFREVLGPAGFQDGMTSRLYRDDGSYAGMLHVSAADAGTFDHRARDLVAALGTVMSRLTVVKRPPALLPPAPEGALVGVVDHFGGVTAGRRLPISPCDGGPTLSSGCCPLLAVVEPGCGRFVADWSTLGVGDADARRRPRLARGHPGAGNPS